jgi:hypothetical protein
VFSLAKESNQVLSKWRGFFSSMKSTWLRKAHFSYVLLFIFQRQHVVGFRRQGRAVDYPALQAFFWRSRYLMCWRWANAACRTDLGASSTSHFCELHLHKQAI